MSRRIQQINQLIKRELGRIIAKEIDFPPGILVSLTRVETQKDLRESKVYVGCIPEEYTPKALKILQKFIFDIQQKLNKRLKFRPVPKILFVKEKETAKAARVEELLAQLNKENEI